MSNVVDEQNVLGSHDLWTESAGAPFGATATHASREAFTKLVYMWAPLATSC